MDEHIQADLTEIIGNLRGLIDKIESGEVVIDSIVGKSETGILPPTPDD